MLAASMPNPAIYQAMGEENIVRMLEDFYRQLALSSIAAMFPATQAGLLSAARKSALFWITALGGPPLYQEQFGPPRMRLRHQPFPIDQAARDVWLACWEPVLAEAPARYGLPPEHLASLRAWIADFSTHMINRH